MIGSDAIRVLIIEDHRTVLWGLARLVESAAPVLQLADAVTSRGPALAAIAKHRPHVVLLDLDLGEDHGLELLPLIRDQAHVIVLTGLCADELREKSILQGARGVIHKSQPADIVLKAIVRVHHGETWLDRGTMCRLLNTLCATRPVAPRAGPALDLLSRAERKVLAAVLRQKYATNKVIAKALNLSEHTLRNHLASIYSKLGIHRRMELLLYAGQHNDSPSS